MESYKLGDSTPTDDYSYKAKKGLSEKLVREISQRKNEPGWMLEIRLKALKQFEKMPVPEWGANLKEIKWNEIHYYLRSVERPYKTWEEVPDRVRNVFEKIGVPEAEKELLAGVTGQYDSEKIYGSLKKSLAKKGVVFLSMDEGLKEYPELVKKYFGTIVPSGDNKLAALNTAVWSGGSFVYVPRGVKVGLPLQAYFRINAENAGQFERTLIVVEEGAEVHYVEGCSAPAYSSASLHAAVVEVVVKPKAKCRYTTVQNWYKNVYNLVTKRAWVEREARMEWVDCNLGSKVTMKYPSCLLMGERASGSMLSIAVAGSGQQLDAGAKMIHLALKTTSQIISKSISKDGGRSSYRGMVSISAKARGARSKVVCDALILDARSRSDTYPTNRIMNKEVVLEHEAYVSKIGEEQVSYLRSRGLTEKQAETMIVRGFLEPVVGELPMEYAVELNRLVKMEMEGSVG
ncbi:MAG: Fe-S cluster assembly protein SufB [bacterium]